MRKELDEVREFMKIGGQSTPEHPTWTGGTNTAADARLIELGHQLQHEGSHLRNVVTKGIGSPVDALRIGLILEETGELATALGNRDFVETADALADLLYVVLGAAVTYGIDIGPVWAEVHRSNMAKFPGGVALRDASGKIQKPPGWKPPDVGKIMAEQIRASFTTVFSHPELEPESLLACKRCGGVFPVDPIGEENLVQVGGVLVPKCLWCAHTGHAESKVTLSMETGKTQMGDEGVWVATAYFEDPLGTTEHFGDNTPYGAYHKALEALGIERPGVS